jgi:hypothetical protein
MIGFGESFLAWTASTLFPAFAGLVLITGINKLLDWLVFLGNKLSRLFRPRLRSGPLKVQLRIDEKYLAAFAFGIFLWFFFDTISGSATLDVNSGFGGGPAQVAVVILFVAGALLFFSVDQHRNIFSAETAIGKYGIVIPLLVAAAVGIHGLGEGWDFGHTAYATSSADLLNAFGGVMAAVAYVLHKALEPMMVGACYAVYTKGQARSGARWIRDLFLLSIVFVFASLVGATGGYYVSFDTTYFFAIGTGTSIYAAFRLVGPLFIPNRTVRSKDTLQIAVALLLGFIAIYIAALFHS